MKVVKVEPVFEPVQCSFGACASVPSLPQLGCFTEGCWAAWVCSEHTPGNGWLRPLGKPPSDRQPWPSCLTSSRWAQGQETTREEISPETEPASVRDTPSSALCVRPWPSFSLPSLPSPALPSHLLLFLDVGVFLQVNNVY